ncbi:hypothetical protein EAI_15449 [Harpegnathos saltator]|uniref:Uncharacterized protein n=3 Tax=Harpegnathos saltator TaxID=610380 RepID=E2BLG1_HARSA|nr:hypothetical protein EAI_15449 [Harpegnathos saltator]
MVKSQAISWLCWLLAVCICLSDAKSKVRRPLPPLYAVVLKKPRPIGHRISMGNTIHIGANFPHQRVPYKHVNYRPRRPVYNVLPASWKNQIPMRATLNNNRAVLPQRVPLKEFHSVNKVPEYSPEYRPELVVLPATHRGGIDDDKGPIHTIPAPNLSPADKPYNSPVDQKEIADRRPYPADLNYHTTAQNSNVGLAAIDNSLSLQRPATSPSTPQHQYEVTESNDAVVLKDHQAAVQSVTLQPQDLDVTRLYSTIMNPHPHSSELFVNHPVNGNAAVVGPNVVQFGQSSVPMQTNLHSSLHVGFPATAVQTPYTVAQQQIPELHVGHPAPAGPPLSATQLYDLLNSFPHKFAEQYTPDQQHILQQQLDQILQPDGITSFSQPQMHSFNYDEQANQLQQQLQQQQQQQQILLDQDYASGSVTADYNLDPESSVDARKQNDVRASEELAYPVDGVEQSENNIEYEATSPPRSPTPYSRKPGNIGGAIATKFYTTLPNRDAAEKLAALAAAGNVNSRLMGQLRKRQQQQQQQWQDMQSDESMPPNHKNDDNAGQQTWTDGEQLQRYNQHNKHQKNQQQRRKQGYKSAPSDEKLPLQITVPEEDEYASDDQLSDIRKDNADVEYEYEGEDGEGEGSQESAASFAGQAAPHDDDPHVEFGSRLRSKTRE